MVIQHLGVVHLVDVITGEDENIFGVVTLNKGDILADGIGGAGVPVTAAALLVGGQYKYAAVQPVQIPRLAVAQVFIEHQRLVLSQYAHSIYAGIDTVGKGEIDDAVFAAKGHRGLGQLLVRAYSRLPWPPASSMATHSFFMNI